MKRCFYDKECTKEIKCFYDPCYRTGDFYSKYYICDLLEYDTSDNLYSIVSRIYDDKDIIYFEDEYNLYAMKFVCSIVIRVKNKRSYYICFDYNGESFVFDEHGYNTELQLVNLSLIPKKKPKYELFRLVTYSFSPNYKDKDNEICPELYANVPPMSEEEKEIVKIRMTENPYYKSDSYK